MPKIIKCQTRGAIEEHLLEVLHANQTQSSSQPSSSVSSSHTVTSTAASDVIPAKPSTQSASSTSTHAEVQSIKNKAPPSSVQQPPPKKAKVSSSSTPTSIADVVRLQMDKYMKQLRSEQDNMKVEIQNEVKKQFEANKAELDNRLNAFLAQLSEDERTAKSGIDMSSFESMMEQKLEAINTRVDAKLQSLLNPQEGDTQSDGGGDDDEAEAEAEADTTMENN